MGWRERPSGLLVIRTGKYLSGADVVRLNDFQARVAATPGIQIAKLSLIAATKDASGDPITYDPATSEILLWVGDGAPH